MKIRSAVSVIVCFFITVGVHAQCLTDFTKLLPEPSLDFSQNFGRSVSMYDNYLAIGIPYNDSLGRITGIVHMYEKVNGTWIKIAALAPSVPQDALQFGSTVKLSKDYLLVGAAGYGGKVFVFKKPVSGWVSQTEITTLSASNTFMFGSSDNNPIDISADQQTIAITDPYYDDPLHPFVREGIIFVYHKQPGDEWTNTLTPAVILPPEDMVHSFGRGGVALQGNRIATFTIHAPTGNGQMYVYNDPSGEFTNPVLEARLSVGDVTYSYSFGFRNFAFTEDGIFVSASVDMQTANPKEDVIFFEMPASGPWPDSQLTCHFDPDGNTDAANRSPVFSTNGTDLYISSLDANNKGYFTILKKGPSGWCDPVRETIDFSPPPVSGSAYYGVVNACNQNTNAIVGLVPHPDNDQAQIALKTFSKTPAGDWESQLVFPTKKSTAGHYYGREILGFDNYLFVGAPYDGTVKASAGAVYSYKKTGTTWQKTGKILAPPRGAHDDVFGTALANNSTQLAVGASGYEPHGKVFIYKNNSADWSTLDLIQEIDLPSNLIVYAFGDNLAMNDEWLVIPYIQNSPARIILAIYKFNGSTWSFHQAVEVGAGNIFLKETTIAVDIENDIILAGNQILEKNSSGFWDVKYTLSPSDPEPMQISSDFTHWITNGSLFGYSAAIHDNTIFIGAPTKDFESTWDVGAVYVYTKRPDESWSSRTETSKIVPRIKDEGELFGFALRPLFNTLIVGAPGADFYKDNTARNKPGRAYVYQSEEYYWQDVNWLIDFTGDSFVKDYYGASVYMDQTDFFIGAPIEDISNAKLSGSVYITPTPPIIKLVPPVCSTSESADLFGYPFGGIWAGPGLTDPVEGIFNPSSVGAGFHEFTYTTPSCAFQGRLRIQVEDPPAATLLTPALNYTCKGEGVSIPLGIEPQANCHYQWYYRANNTGQFAALDEKASSMIAKERGEYQALVSNYSCSSLTPIITVADELVDIVIQDEKICEKSTSSITLQASPTGGVWQGTGVTNGTFVPGSLPGGVYGLIYTFTSPTGCVFKKAGSVEIVKPFIPSISRLNGNLCLEGEVTLSMQPEPPDSYTIHWAKKDITGNFETIQEGEKNFTLTEHGIYNAEVNNGICKSSSKEIIIQDSLSTSMSPSGTKFEVCHEDNLELSFDAQPTGVTYNWYYFKETGQAHQLLSFQENLITPQESGYYYASLNSGVCHSVSHVKQVVIHPSDSIFVPNVFTPNGDGKNDLFTVFSTYDYCKLSITNRYGVEIYTGDASDGWDGEGTSTGVYYWFISFNTCSGDRKTVKGYVHLMR